MGCFFKKQKEVSMRKAFTFYSSYYESIKELPILNQEELYRAIIEYSFDKKEPKLTGISTSIWYLIKPNIENNISKYENGKQPKNKGLRKNKKQDISESEAKKKQKQSGALSLSLIINKDYYTNKELNSTFKELLKLRHQLEAVNSEYAINLIINKLKPYEDDIKIKMIEQAIENSWKSVFPLKTTPTKTTQDVPKWFNKEVKQENLSKEEEEELKNSLEEF